MVWPKKLVTKKETIRGYFVLWQGNFCVLSMAKRKWCWKYLRLWQLLKRRCGDIVQSLSITSEPALTSWQMKVIQLWNVFNISSILCFSMKVSFKHFVNISAIAKIFCKKKKSLLQAQSNRINHGNKERKYVSEGIKIRGVSNRHCLCRYENKRREVFRWISGPFYPQYNINLVQWAWVRCAVTRITTCCQNRRDWCISCTTRVR